MKYVWDFWLEATRHDAGHAELITSGKISVVADTFDVAFSRALEAAKDLYFHPDIACGVTFTDAGVVKVVRGQKVYA